MRKTHATTLALAGALAGALPACALNVGDLNNPSLDDLQSHPTPVTIGAASTGLLIGNRGNRAAENGFVMELGILGREAAPQMERPAKAGRQARARRRRGLRSLLR